jgi:hypothetical protein
MFFVLAVVLREARQKQSQSKGGLPLCKRSLLRETEGVAISRTELYQWSHL